LEAGTTGEHDRQREQVDDGVAIVPDPSLPTIN
jgi:hypothetical protein